MSIIQFINRPAPFPLSTLALLYDRSKPLPMFIEGWALTSGMAGQQLQVPTGTSIPTDSEGAMKLEYTVSGSAGEASLAISAGDESKGTGIWAAVLLHDDGNYGFYTISALSGGTCTVFPNLRADVTAQTMTNAGSGVNGQHYTEPAYKALAHQIYGTTRRSAYRNRYAAQWRASQGSVNDWSRLGGLTAGQVGISARNNYVDFATSKARRVFITRHQTSLQGLGASPMTGKGFTKNFDLNGHSGHLEAFVACARISNGTGGGFYPFTVQAQVDGVDFHTVNYVENDGGVRVLIDYPSGTTGTFKVTFTDNSGPANTTGIFIDSVTWWTYDRTPVGYAWSDSVIRRDSKIVLVGDSWGSRYSGVLGTELQAAMAADGGSGSVVNVSVAGQNSEEALATFDSLVGPESPDQVVIEFFTNDQTDFGAANYARWLDAMYRMGIKAQELGAEPIFVMPLPTSSLAQAIVHGNWAAELGAGLPTLA